MRYLSEQDLFDLLGICFREDSYTELLANVFQNDNATARGFLRSFLNHEPPTGPIRAETRVSTGRRTREKAIPDLVLLFGDPVTHVWVVEAKIEAGEGDRQTERYGLAGPALLDALGVPEAELIHPSAFLTLDPQVPRGDGFRSVTYEPLATLLEPGRFADPALSLAVACLKDRLTGYYAAVNEVPDPETSLADYLASARGLITAKDQFHQLTKTVGDRMGFKLTAGVAQNAASAHPYQTFNRRAWKSDSMDEGCSLAKCFWVHLEAHLLPECENEVRLLLHYETNPYRAKLAAAETDLEGFTAYLERRASFARRLSDVAQAAGLTPSWRFVSPKTKPTSRNQNLVASLRESFSAEGTIAEFEDWLGKELVGMAKAIDTAMSGLLRE